MATIDASKTEPVSPSQWRDWAPAALKAPAPSQFDRAKLQCWSGTDPRMDMPALDHHLIVLHRGGPKRVTRTNGKYTRTVEVAPDTTTTVESGSAYGWHTQGPIDFAHLYVAPDRFGELVGRTFDRDPLSVGFAETIGRADPCVARLLDLMIDGRDDPDWALVSDYYLDALLIRLASISGSGEFRGPKRIALTPRTVTRVRDFIRAHLRERLSLDDMAEVAGYSRYHFVRAFKDSTGVPPYAYLLRERIGVAKVLLRAGDVPIADVARAAGFVTHAQFSSRFRATTGVTPAEYRRRRILRDVDSGPGETTL